MNNPRVAAEYHRLTSYTPGFLSPEDPRKVRSWAGPMREPPPERFKRYPTAERIPLPRELPALGVSASAAVSGEGREGRAAFDAVALSRLLFYSAGVVRFLGDDGARLYFRAAGSAGNLFPLELYVISGANPGLQAGLYHYAALEHALARLAAGDHRRALADALADDRAAAAPASIVITGVPWRSAWKYRERAFRHLYWDAGTMLGQLLPLAGASSATLPFLHLGFVDAVVGELLGVDGTHEFPLAVVSLGSGGRPAEADVEHPEPPPGELGRHRIEFPLITAAQRAGDLGKAADVAAWRAALTDRPVAVLDRVPALALRTPPLEEVILRRGSTRRFRARPGPRELLEWACAAAARPTATDVLASGATLLEHAVALHAVEGFEPGIYRWTGDGLVLTRRGDVREETAFICAEQALAGDGAYTVFHLADLAPLLEAGGSRAYRAALLEAGIVSGRWQLAAHALGFGATGLTFWDSEARRVFGRDALLVTAVGAPAYRSRAGGPPGRPARLRGIPSPLLAARA